MKRKKVNQPDKTDVEREQKLTISKKKKKKKSNIGIERNVKECQEIKKKKRTLGQKAPFRTS